MKTISLNEAMSLLDKAFGIYILDADCNPEAQFHLTLDDEDEFLYLEADNDEGLHWTFRFRRAHNETVKIDGDRMTLVCDDDEDDGSLPELDIRILVPMQLEAVLEAEALPFVARKALDHVRLFHPEVDRVTFWDDGRWSFMTDGHEVPKFDGRVDVGLLEDASDSLPAGRPFAFQIHEGE
jgi:hypothetical protein